MGKQCLSPLASENLAEFLICRSFVDVVHTNAGIYGKLESCGHLDFYLNNGQFQVNYSQTIALFAAFQTLNLPTLFFLLLAAGVCESEKYGKTLHQPNRSRAMQT
jgi:hypothetical protein